MGQSVGRRDVILVDSSVWIDHFRKPDPVLQHRLLNDAVLCHPYITVEVACGSFANRASILRFLSELPQALEARDDEVLRLIQDEALMGIGIGYLDAHLLTSTKLTHETLLWTRDKRLAAAATRLGLAVPIH